MSSTLPLGCSCSHAVDIRGGKFCSYISRLRPCREDAHEETTYQLPSLACMHEQNTRTFTRNIMNKAHAEGFKGHAEYETCLDVRAWHSSSTFHR